MGVEKLRKHANHYDDPTFFDTMGLAWGDPSFNNLIMAESAVQNGHPQAD